jgi:hypothetical protein
MSADLEAEASASVEGGDEDIVSEETHLELRMLDRSPVPLEFIRRYLSVFVDQIRTLKPRSYTFIVDDEVCAGGLNTLLLASFPAAKVGLHASMGNCLALRLSTQDGDTDLYVSWGM